MHNTLWLGCQCYKKAGATIIVDHVRENQIAFKKEKIKYINNPAPLNATWIGEGYIFYQSSNVSDQDAFILIPQQEEGYLMFSLRTAEEIKGRPKEFTCSIVKFIGVRDLKAATAAARTLTEAWAEQSKDEMLVSLNILRRRLDNVQ